MNKGFITTSTLMAIIYLLIFVLGSAQFSPEQKQTVKEQVATILQEGSKKESTEVGTIIEPQQTEESQTVVVESSKQEVVAPVEEVKKDEVKNLPEPTCGTARGQYFNSFPEEYYNGLRTDSISLCGIGDVSDKKTIDDIFEWSCTTNKTIKCGAYKK